jgi:hypothetical protein
VGGGGGGGGGGARHPGQSQMKHPSQSHQSATWIRSTKRKQAHQLVSNHVTWLNGLRTELTAHCYGQHAGSHGGGGGSSPPRPGNGADMDGALGNGPPRSARDLPSAADGGDPTNPHALASDRPPATR